MKDIKLTTNANVLLYVMLFFIALLLLLGINLRQYYYSITSHSQKLTSAFLTNKIRLFNSD